MIPVLAILALNSPVGYISNTNIASMRSAYVYRNDMLVLPPSDPRRENDYFLTVKFFDSCVEDTYINSVNKITSVIIDRVPAPGQDCDYR
jgi:hypothetical protein